MLTRVTPCQAGVDYCQDQGQEDVQGGEVFAEEAGYRVDHQAHTQISSGCVGVQEKWLWF